MEHMKEFNQTKQENRINKDFYSPETLLADTIEKRILLRMADLNITPNAIPSELRKLMKFENNVDGHGITASFTDKFRTAFYADNMIKPDVLYVLSLVMKTNPSVFYYGEQKGFGKLSPNPEFIPMDTYDALFLWEAVMSVPNISKRLKEIRTAKSFTVAKVAEILGVSPATIINYENPEKRKKLRLTTKQLFDFSEACDISPDLILLGMDFDSLIEKRENNEDILLQSGVNKQSLKMIQSKTHSISNRIKTVMDVRSFSVEEILQCRQWIIDNIDKVDPLTLLSIQKIIKNAMKRDSNASDKTSSTSQQIFPQSDDGYNEDNE